jgi:hypothetical protein
MWIEPETFEPVAQILKDMRYEPFSSPGDRHGSWQWPFYRKSGDIARFVILAATPEAQGNGIQVELWIGAEADQRFTRERFESFRWDAEELPEKVQTLVEGAIMAVERANSLRQSDLREGLRKLQDVPAEAY